MKQLFKELKRRNVYKVAVAYAAAAFVVVQAARLLVPALLLPDWIYRAVVLAAILGFPIALVIAWAFELTPEGVQRTSAEAGEAEEPRSMSQEERRPQSRLAMKALVGLGLVGAAVAGGWHLIGGGGEPEAEPRLGERSIAVLPFEALGKQEPGAFTEGMHDDLLARLSSVSGLKVISRTSVQQYRDTEKTAAEIARELGVRWVLEGGVQEMGDQIQVNAQLIDPRTDTHAWADTYRRALTAEDLFALQSDITRRIASSLEAKLSPEETERVKREPTGDLEAYQLYVRGRTQLDTRTEEGIRKGVSYFRRAIRQDSSYALAWTGLADAMNLLAFYGHGSSDTLHPQALDAARRALAINPELAEAHASLGSLYRDHRNVAGALRELKRAIELKPSYARAYHWLGNLEMRMGFPELALQHHLQAVALDPRSPPIQVSLAWSYWWIEGPGQKALEHARRAVELEPNYVSGHLAEGFILSNAGQYKKAIPAFERALGRAAKRSSHRRRAMAGLGITYARAGDTARARKLLSRLEQEENASLQEAMIQAALGNEAQAVQALQNTEWTSDNVWLLRSRPVFEAVRNDLRYEELIRKANQQWGLNPDGSLPDSVNVSFDAPTDE